MDDDGVAGVAVQHREGMSVKVVHAQDVHPRHDRAVRVRGHGDPVCGRQAAAHSYLHRGPPRRECGRLEVQPRGANGRGDLHRQAVPPWAALAMHPRGAGDAPGDREGGGVRVTAVKQHGGNADLAPNLRPDLGREAHVEADKIEGDDRDLRVALRED